MNENFTILDEGRSDTIDPLSPFEMSNILGGADEPCTNGYCKKNYSEDIKGNMFCGCGYIKPIIDPEPDQPDPTDPDVPVMP